MFVSRVRCLHFSRQTVDLTSEGIPVKNADDNHDEVLQSFT